MATYRIQRLYSSFSSSSSYESSETTVNGKTSGHIKKTYVEDDNGHIRGRKIAKKFSSKEGPFKTTPAEDTKDAAIVGLSAGLIPAGLVKPINDQVYYKKLDKIEDKYLKRRLENLKGLEELTKYDSILGSHGLQKNRDELQKVMKENIREGQLLDKARERSRKIVKDRKSKALRNAYLGTAATGLLAGGAYKLYKHNQKQNDAHRK